MSTATSSPAALGIRRQHRLVLSLFFFLIATVVVAEVLFLPSDYRLFSIIFAIHLGLYAFPIFRSQPFDWFEPPVFAAMLGLLGQYRIIYLIFYKDFRTEFLNVPLETSISISIQVLLLLILARLCYYAGYYTHYGEQWSLRIPIPSAEWSGKRIRVLVTIGTMMAVACLLILTWNAGGPFSYFRNLGYWKIQTRLDGMESFRRGIYVLPYLGVLWFVYRVTRVRERSDNRVVFWTCLSLMFVIPLWSGSRSSVVFPAIALVMAYHYLVRRLSLIKIIVLSSVAILSTNLFLEYRLLTGQFTRDLSNQQTAGPVTDRTYGPIEVINEAVEDRRSFDQLMYRVNTTRIPEDLKWGQTYLYLLVTPIPRSAWPGKKIFSDEVSAEVIPFMPPGFFGELYANFFIPGIMIAYFLWGNIQRSSYAWLKHNQSNKSVIFMYVMFTLLIQEPSMNSLVNGIPMIILFIIFISFISVRTWEARGFVLQSKMGPYGCS